MAVTFYFNDLLRAEAGTALGGIKAEADGLSYHDSCMRKFDLNKHMLATIRIEGSDEPTGGSDQNRRLTMTATAASMPLTRRNPDGTTAGDMSPETRYVTVLKVRAYPTLEEAQNPTWLSIDNNTDWYNPSDETSLVTVELKGITDEGIYVMRKYGDDNVNQASNRPFNKYNNARGGLQLMVTYNGGALMSTDSYDVVILNGGVGYSTDDDDELQCDNNDNNDTNALSNMRGTIAVKTVNNQGTVLTAEYTPTEVPLNINDQDHLTLAYDHGTSYAEFWARPIIGGIDNSRTGRVDDSSFQQFQIVTNEAGIIEDHTNSETTEENVDRYTLIGGTIRVGQAQLEGLYNPSTDTSQMDTAMLATFKNDLAHTRAQVHMGRRQDIDASAVGDNAVKPELVNSTGGAYTPILLGDTNLGLVAGTGLGSNDPYSRGTETLIDAFASNSNERDEKMWESMLTQLALTSITKYTPNVDFSATNLIDFGVPLKSKNDAGALVDDYVSRGLHPSYLGYVTQRFTEGNGASTFAEMIRSIKDVVPTHPETPDDKDSKNPALVTIVKEMASANRVVKASDDAAGNISCVKLTNGDKIHLTVQIDVRDVDDHEIPATRGDANNETIGNDSISPNFLGLAYDNETEQSVDVNTHAGYNTAKYATDDVTGNPDYGATSAHLLRLNFLDNVVRVPMPTAVGRAALRLRLVCEHKDAE